MKKIKLLAVALLIGAGVSAQQGQWYVGGVLGFSSQGNDQNDDKYSTWNAAPEVGYWLKNDIQVGIALGAMGNTTTTYSEDPFLGEIETEVKVNDFSPRLYGRKYWSVGDRLMTYAGLNFDIITGKSTTTVDPENGESAEQEMKRSGFGAEVDFGVSFALSESFSIMGRIAALSYTLETTEMTDVDDSAVSTNTFGLLGDTYSAPFNIGLYYTFVK